MHEIVDGYRSYLVLLQSVWQMLRNCDGSFFCELWEQRKPPTWFQVDFGGEKLFNRWDLQMFNRAMTKTDLFI